MAQMKESALAKYTVHHSRKINLNITTFFKKQKYRVTQGSYAERPYIISEPWKLKPQFKIFLYVSNFCDIIQQSLKSNCWVPIE